MRFLSLLGYNKVKSFARCYLCPIKSRKYVAE